MGQDRKGEWVKDRGKHYSPVWGQVLLLASTKCPQTEAQGSGFRLSKEYLRSTVYSLYKVMT